MESWRNGTDPTPQYSNTPLLQYQRTLFRQKTINPMRVLLISANTEKINMPTLPVGLGCVAAAVREAGHEIRFLDLMVEDDAPSALKRAISAFEPDIVGVSIRNIDDQSSRSPALLVEDARSVVSVCRRLSTAPVVLGGAGYSMFPESALDYLGADMGIQGEGEVAFPLLLGKLSVGKETRGVPGLYVRGKGLQGERRFIRNLDELPLPSPDLFDRRVADNPAYYLPVQTRRGCPLGCSYCSTSMIEGALIRKRSPQRVIEMLAHWRQSGFSRVFFVDNTFNLPPSYAFDLCRQLAAAGLDIEWRCILYPGKVDAPLIEGMARAGCREVSLGFESGHQDILDAMNKRFNLEDIRRTRTLLKTNGIGCMGFLLLGGPGETRQTVTESLDFVESLELDALRLTIGIRIYPGTRLAGIARAEGVIGVDDDLLMPKFYIAGGLEDWLRRTVGKRAANHPNWII